MLEKNPYHPQGRDFILQEIPSPWYIWVFGLTQPPPQGNYNPFCGGLMDIFWRCTQKFLMIEILQELNMKSQKNREIELNLVGHVIFMSQMTRL